MAIQLAFFLEIDCAIDRIQNGVKLWVAVVRFGPGGIAAEGQVDIGSRRDPSTPAADGKRPFRPLVPKGIAGIDIDRDFYAGQGGLLFKHLGIGRTKAIVSGGECELKGIIRSIARLSQQRFGPLDVLRPPVHVGVGAIGGGVGQYPVVVGHPAQRLDEVLDLLTILGQLEGLHYVGVRGKGFQVDARHDGRNPSREKGLDFDLIGILL